jgi:hypothetical protein
MRIMTMNITLIAMIVASALASTSAAAGPYDGTPFYGTYSTYDYGANRYFDVTDRYGGSGG